MTRSISSKLIVLLTLSLSVVISIGIAIDYRLSRAAILDRLQLESSETIEAAVSEMDNWLDGVKGSTLFLARILQQRDYSQAGLNQMLRDIVENNNDIFGAAIALNPRTVEHTVGFASYYYHKNGLLTAVDLAVGGEPYWTKNWYLAPVEAGKPLWVEPYFDHDGAEVLMTTFSVPVFHTDEQGQKFLYGVVTADVSLNDLQLSLRHLQLGESGFAIIMSREGIVLSAKTRSFIMQHYRSALSAAPELPAWEAMVGGALTGLSQTRLLECPELSGNCLVHMSALQSTGWPVGVIYSEDEMLLPLQQYAMKTAFTGLMILLIVAFAISVISRRLTRHLTSLVEVTDELSRGNFDVGLPAISGHDEVARLIRSFRAMKSEIKSHIANLEQATAARSRLEGELSAAREIQMSMLPQDGEALEQSADFSLWAKVRPAKTVGGDLYTYSAQADGVLLLAVGDVSDKGVPAALFMAKTLSHLQQYTQTSSNPAAVMSELNNALELGNTNCMFVTLFLAVLDLRSGVLEFVSAGHTPPRLIREGTACPLVQESGPALGLAPDLEFPSNTAQLRSGDRLAIYTDGIDEAFNAGAQMYGHERLAESLVQTRGESIEQAGDKVIKAVDAFADATPQSDDITLMLVDFAPMDPAQRPPALGRNFSRGPQLLRESLEWLEHQLQETLPDQTYTMELVLVAEEIITNIDKYAQLPTGAEIAVSVAIDENRIDVEFSDRGAPFNPLLEADKAVLGEDIENADIGGLGVHLILKLTDQQHYQRLADRNILRISKLLK